MSSPSSSPEAWTEKLTIETPEQTSLDYPLAGVGSRFLALLLDSLLQFAAAIGLAILLAALGFGMEALWRGSWIWIAAVWILIGFILYFGYFALFETLWNGQTPGKRFVRLRVIQDSGRPITVYHAVGRNLLRLVDQLPVFYAVGIITVLISRQNKRLGDYVAGTVVVREGSSGEVQPDWTAGQTAEASTMDFHAAGLNAEEVQLIETYLRRRDQLERGVRARMAKQIAEGLAQKLSLSIEDRRAAGGDDSFLEMLLQQNRKSSGYR